MATREITPCLEDRAPRSMPIGEFKRSWPFLLIWAACVGTCADLIAVDEGGFRGARQSLFSDQELARLYREIPVPLVHDSDEWLRVEGPVIELEPYVVVGDESPYLLAAVRRHFDLGPESIRRRVQELAPRLGQQAEIAGRAYDRFFSPARIPGPPDRPSMLYVSSANAPDLGRAITETLERTLNRDRRE